MRVVSDTSPISNLAIIGRLDLLRQRYGEVRIPGAVKKELAVLTRIEARKSIEDALSEGWIIVFDNPPARLPPSDRVFIGLGEASAIDLALDVKAALVLIDEKKGREVARRHGLTAGGLLGELLQLHAKQRGRLPDLKREIVRLRSEARFFVSTEIERFILSEAGE
jgi:uncharacterized protein